MPATTPPAPNPMPNVEAEQKRVANVSPDGSCLYYSVALGYLLPVYHDVDEFRRRFILSFTELGMEHFEMLRDKLAYYDGSSEKFDELLDVLKHLVNSNLRTVITEFIKANIADYLIIHNRHLEEGVPVFCETTFRAYLDYHASSLSWAGPAEMHALQVILNIRIASYRINERNELVVHSPVPAGDSPLVEVIYRSASLEVELPENHYDLLIKPSLLEPLNRTGQVVGFVAGAVVAGMGLLLVSNPVGWVALAGTAIMSAGVQASVHSATNRNMKFKDYGKQLVIGCATGLATGGVCAALAPAAGPVAAVGKEALKAGGAGAVTAVTTKAGAEVGKAAVKEAGKVLLRKAAVQAAGGAAGKFASAAAEASVNGQNPLIAMRDKVGLTGALAGGLTGAVSGVSSAGSGTLTEKWVNVANSSAKSTLMAAGTGAVAGGLTSAATTAISNTVEGRKMTEGMGASVITGAVTGLATGAINGRSLHSQKVRTGEFKRVDLGGGKKGDIYNSGRPVLLTDEHKAIAAKYGSVDLATGTPVPRHQLSQLRLATLPPANPALARPTGAAKPPEEGAPKEFTVKPTDAEIRARIAKDIESRAGAPSDGKPRSATDRSGKTFLEKLRQEPPKPAAGAGATPMDPATFERLKMDLRERTKAVMASRSTLAVPPMSFFNGKSTEGGDSSDPSKSVSTTESLPSRAELEADVMRGIDQLIAEDGALDIYSLLKTDYAKLTHEDSLNKIQTHRGNTRGQEGAVPNAKEAKLPTAFQKALKINDAVDKDGKKVAGFARSGKEVSLVPLTGGESTHETLYRVFAHIRILANATDPKMRNKLKSLIRGELNGYKYEKIIHTAAVRTLDACKASLREGETIASPEYIKRLQENPTQRSLISIVDRIKESPLPRSVCEALAALKEGESIYLNTGHHEWCEAGGHTVCMAYTREGDSIVPRLHNYGLGSPENRHNITPRTGVGNRDATMAPVQYEPIPAAGITENTAFKDHIALVLGGNYRFNLPAKSILAAISEIYNSLPRSSVCCAYRANEQPSGNCPNYGQANAVYCDAGPALAAVLKKAEDAFIDAQETGLLDELSAKRAFKK